MSVDGAKASAMYYSLIETAKKNGFEPFDYLTKMLEKLLDTETVENFEARNFGGTIKKCSISNRYLLKRDSEVTVSCEELSLKYSQDHF